MGSTNFCCELRQTKSSSQQKVLLVPSSGSCSSTAFSNSIVSWASSPASVVKVRWMTIDLSSLHCEVDTDIWSASMVVNSAPLSQRLRIFEECCSLTQIGVTQCPDNILAPQAQLRPRVFQGCTALQHLDLGKKGQGSTNLNRSLPDCCFLEAGIVALYLPSDFNRIGTAACVSCQQLRTVDLSQTNVIEILGSTFAKCSQLQQLSLSRNLRIIEQEAFLKCTSLQEVCIPPSLLYIARRAFAGCTQLRAVRKQGKSKTWRGTYAWLNAFDKCEQLDKPQWLRFLPPNANDQWRDDF